MNEYFNKINNTFLKILKGNEISKLVFGVKIVNS